MMTTDELRQILNRPELTDKQLEQIRDTLTCLARVFIDGYLQERKNRFSSEKR